MDYLSMMRCTGCMKLSELLIIAIPLYLKTHRWNPTDYVEKVVESIKERICGGIVYQIEAEVIVDGKCIEIPAYEHKSYAPDKLILTPSDFFEAILNDMKHYNLPIPDEVYELLDLPSESKRKIRDSEIDKAVCQGIARTLWENDPKLTIEAIRKSKAIQIFGNGQVYKDDKTLRGWISEVDVRTSKRGRKKTITKELSESESQ